MCCLENAKMTNKFAQIIAFVQCEPDCLLKSFALVKKVVQSSAFMRGGGVRDVSVPVPCLEGNNHCSLHLQQVGTITVATQMVEVASDEYVYCIYT